MGSFCIANGSDIGDKIQVFMQQVLQTPFQVFLLN
jgi:hypothetical protein